MKKSVWRITAFALCVVMISLAFASCGGLKARYSSYDSSGERYDCDLTEYIAVPIYTGIEVPEITYTPTDEEIADQRMLKLAYFAEEENVNEPCEKYDLVDADYSAEVEGLNYGIFDSTVDNSRRSFMVGIGHFGVAEIDDAIVGMAPGEEKTIEFTFPEPFYKDIQASGKTGTFKIKIEKVRRQDLAEYNDEFVSTYYGAASAADYDEEIKEQLIHDTGLGYEDYEEQLTWEYVFDNSILYKYPGTELNEARDSIVANYRSRAEKAEMGFDEYLKSIGYEDNMQFYDEYVEPYARTIVKEEMIALFIARCEDLSVSDEEYNSEMLDYCSYYEVTDTATCERIINSDFGSKEAFREQILMKKAREFLVDSEVKLEPAKYYENKHAGKYELTEEEVLKDTETISDETVIFIILGAAGALLVAFIIILVVKLKKAVKDKNVKLAEKAALEEKRRIRREMKAAKKK